ncbi:hypothetical protein ACROYT_G001265 [Oculina patagonica]
MRPYASNGTIMMIMIGFEYRYHYFSSHTVDITGESVGLDPEGDDSLAQEISVSAASIVQSMATLNPAFGSITGDPFSDEIISSDPGSSDESTDGSLSDDKSSLVQ